ncbi:MAG: hypothetical protein ACLRYY_06270 [Anaerobutyricum soehngenii]
MTKSSWRTQKNGKIFKNMAHTQYMIVAIVLLLIIAGVWRFVAATSMHVRNVGDVRIQNKGVEHILPVK